MRRILSLIIAFAALLTCLSGCSLISGKDSRSFEGNYILNDEKHSTDEQVYVTADLVEMVDGKPTFHITWHNESDRVICYGLGYKVERLDGDSWVDVMVEDFAIMEIACIINPGESGTQSYRLEYFDLTKEGSYRIYLDYFYSDEQGGSGSTYVTFLKENK